MPHIGQHPVGDRLNRHPDRFFDSRIEVRQIHVRAIISDGDEQAASRSDAHLGHAVLGRELQHDVTTALEDFRCRR